MLRRSLVSSRRGWLKQALKNARRRGREAGRLTEAQAEGAEGADRLGRVPAPVRPGRRVIRALARDTSTSNTSRFSTLLPPSRDHRGRVPPNTLEDKTLAEIAKEKGKSVSGLVAGALVAAQEKRIAAAVADGRLTQSQASELKAHLEEAGRTSSTVSFASFRERAPLEHLWPGWDPRGRVVRRTTRMKTDTTGRGQAIKPAIRCCRTPNWRQSIFRSCTAAVGRWTAKKASGCANRDLRDQGIFTRRFSICGDAGESGGAPFGGHQVRAARAIPWTGARLPSPSPQSPCTHALWGCKSLERGTPSMGRVAVPRSRDGSPTAPRPRRPCPSRSARDGAMRRGDLSSFGATRARRRPRARRRRAW